MTVEELFNKNFNVPRTPRSAEYWGGVRAALAFRLESKKIVLPYRVGTAAADAFFAGVDAGHLIWRQSKEQAA